MGVTIHYSGCLPDKKKQRQLCDELEDICSSMSWDYQLIQPDSRRDPPVQGIIFVPQEQCEPVVILFDDEGFLCHASALVAYDPDADYQKIVSTKTQFCPPEIHIVIVKLLRYIKARYIPDLNVQDEGEYWETNDRSRLEKNLEQLGHVIDSLSKKLENCQYDVTQAKLAGTMGDKLEEILKNMLADAAEIVRIENPKQNEKGKNSHFSLN